MADRYFVERPIDGPRAHLAGGEAHHLIHVMRAESGHRVTLFDGSGAEFSARVESVGRTDVELSITDRVETDRELPFRLTLAVAMPKGDRQRWLVEKATELGIARLVPLVTERSGGQTTATSASKLRRAVIEASKQCGRNRLMKIAPPRAWAELLHDSANDSLRLFAHPGAPTWAGATQQRSPTDSPRDVAIAIGPEGGFTDEECDAALAAGWQAVGLGPRTLRVETAALALSAAVIAARSPATSS